MSKFTVALNDVLERMKTQEGTTRQSFAKRIGMNYSTLHNYANGRSVSSPEALGQIAAGLQDPDAFRIISAYIFDSIPESWRSRITVHFGEHVGTKFAISGHDTLEKGFKDNIELIVEEAERNEHMVPFVEEFVALLGLDVPKKKVDPHGLCPPDTIPHQSVPRGPVIVPPKSSTDSTRQLSRRSKTERGVRKRPT